ncbi:PAS domain-containing protein [Streptomyces sp. NRRL S-1813]|uniref:PAS domain-containing protein n=1 Tax=Streptomyces sp. NRRL S-1813 TaxID=1463888 RepID=UPI0004C8E077|nr:PAS domain-containing protein [Streptomyces sp. NRRL S-1813]
MERGPLHGDDLTLAAPRDAAPGQIPLAVVVVGADGRISHWSGGAHRLFGATREEAVGAPAVDLMPVTGALGDEEWGDRRTNGSAERPGSEGCHGSEASSGGEMSKGAAGANFPVLEASSAGGVPYPTAGRARMATAGTGPVDLLWWAYPLAGPGVGRILVLAADAERLPGGDDGESGAGHERFAPAFGLHTDISGAGGLARRLPEILPSISPQESARIVSQVLELGYPVLEVSLQERFPVTLD